MQDKKTGEGGAPEDGADRARRAAEIVAALETERDEKISKIKKDYDVKIAKARRNAIPIGERRRAALEFLDRLRDSYRTAHGDLLLDESIVDQELVNALVTSLEATVGTSPALDAAFLVLNGKSEDDGSPDAAAGDGADQAGQGDAATGTGNAPADTASGSGASTDDAGAGGDAQLRSGDAAVTSTASGAFAVAADTALDPLAASDAALAASSKVGAASPAANEPGSQSSTDFPDGLVA